MILLFLVILFCIRFAYLCGFGVCCVAARVSSGSEVPCDVVDARVVGYLCWYVVAGARPSADPPLTGGGWHAAPRPGPLAPALPERPTQRRNNRTIPLAVSSSYYTPEEPASKSYSTFHCSVRFLKEHFEALVRATEFALDVRSLWFFIFGRDSVSAK